MQHAGLGVLRPTQHVSDPTTEASAITSPLRASSTREVAFPQSMRANRQSTVRTTPLGTGTSIGCRLQRLVVVLDACRAIARTRGLVASAQVGFVQSITGDTGLERAAHICLR